MKKVLLTLALSATMIIFTACSKPGVDTVTPPEAETPPAEEEKIITEEIAFYYPDEAVMYLCPEVLLVNTRETEFLDSIVQTLINGPVSEELNPSISGDVDVLSAELKDGICTVDLSEEFAISNTGGSTKETMAIYSIINTLCGIDGIEKVKINIEGNESPDFGGHFDLSEPLEPDLSLIKE